MKAAVITISDGCYHKKREDTSGQKLSQMLTENQWEVGSTHIVPDELSRIQEQVLELSQDAEIDLIVTTGGTGLAPRDVTPEAIRPLLEKEIAGLPELMRLRGLESTDFAALSRSLAGARGETLILSLPGSPKGATQSLQAVLNILPHAVDILHGRTAHDATDHSRETGGNSKFQSPNSKPDLKPGTWNLERVRSAPLCANMSLK